MNRCRSLADTLAAIVLASLPLAATGCCGGATETRTHEELALSPTDPSIGNELKACLADDAACLQLCYAVLRENGWEDPETTVTFEECRVFDTPSLELHMTYYVPNECIAGRRPDGYHGTAALVAAASPSPRASWLADMAVLEAAAVHAFAQTARHLQALGAPSALVERCLAAAAEEVVHARLMKELADAEGVRVALPAIAESATPTLEAFALLNATEGCVRETFGALIATYQAAAATDPVIATIMRRIADDETRHAELSRDLDGWARSLLGPAARARLDSARQAAINSLLAAAAGAPDAMAAEELGLPDGAATRALATALFA